MTDTQQFWRVWRKAERRTSSQLAPGDLIYAMPEEVPYGKSGAYLVEYITPTGQLRARELRQDGAASTTTNLPATRVESVRHALPGRSPFHLDRRVPVQYVVIDDTLLALLPKSARRRALEEARRKRP